MDPLRLFISGAASGLGKELALTYGKDGGKVCIADLNEERGLETVNEVKSLGGDAFFQKVDVRSIDDIEAAKDAMIEHWQGVDIVINNAGVASAGIFEKIDLDTWDWMLSINLMGVVRGCKVFTPWFKQQQQGHFVNIASMAGLINPPGMADYNVAKAGVIALSETLRGELHPHNIHTTVVCPSFFQTNLIESLKTTDDVSAEGFDKLLGTSKISAADIANMIKAAVADKVFDLLPHEQAQVAYQYKQTHPEIHFAEMCKIAERNRQKREN